MYKKKERVNRSNEMTKLKTHGMLKLSDNSKLSRQL